MKTIIKFLVLTLLTFLLSGCMKVQVPVTNNIKYIENNVDTRYSQEKEHKVVVIKNAKGTIKQSKELRAGMVEQITTIDTKTVDNITKSFMNQYFQNVSFGNKNDDGFLKISVEIEDDFNFELNQGYTPSFELTFHVLVIQDNKEILNKVYYEATTTPVLMNQLKLWKMSHEEAQREFFNESFHIGVLNFLETKVKPDLLKALEENR